MPLHHCDRDDWTQSFPEWGDNLCSNSVSANYEAAPRVVEEPIIATCAECGRLYRVCGAEEIAAYESESEHLCGWCRSLPVGKCEICGEVHRLHWTYDRDDNDVIGVCHSCYKFYSDSEHFPINRWNYKPTPVFYGESDENVFFGVEVEADCGISGWLAASKITHDFSEVYVKHDGSLDEEGIEVVTHPATLDYHKNNFPWEKILKTMRDYGYLSHETETCGLHIHVSRAFFGADEVEQDGNIAKLILIVQRFWESHIVPFSRRKVNRLQRWAKKPEFKFNTNASIGNIVQKQKDALCRDHYNGVNILPPHTVEFRMFRGTLNYDTILASMELVYALSRFAKKIDLRSIDTCTWEEIFEGLDRVYYKELFDYMERKVHFDSSKIQTIFDENYVEYPYADYETKDVRDSIRPGDYVAIRDWDSMLAEFGLETVRNAINTPHAVFLEEMKPLCGRIVLVTGWNENCQEAVNVQLFEEDPSVNHLMHFYFTRDMLRRLTDEEIGKVFSGFDDFDDDCLPDEDDL